jgi:hypothetical protein
MGDPRTEMLGRQVCTLCPSTVEAKVFQEVQEVFAVQTFLDDAR